MSNDDSILDDLLPCPFCGGIASIGRQTSDGGVFVECIGCQSSSKLIFPDKCNPVPLLIEAWNSRDRNSISRVATNNKGQAFVVYLNDGKKVTIGRDKSTHGPAWLEVCDQLKIKAHSTEDI